MALRRPLKVDSAGNLRVMNSADLEALRNEAIRQYALRPAITLSYTGVGTPANTITAGTLVDTRLVAGASATSISAFPTAAATPDAYAIAVTQDRIAESVAISQNKPIDSSDRGYGIYRDVDGNIRAMTDSDWIDTFILPAIDRLTGASTSPSEAGGTYFISTVTSDPNGTLVSGTPIFTDTRADAGAYTAAGIPEAQDQAIAVQNYYLFRVNAPAQGAIPRPVSIRSDGNIQAQSVATVQRKLAGAILWATNRLVGYRIRYGVDVSGGSGNNRGSGISDTRLNSSTYNQRFINANDYRTQEFPAGTPITISTRFLKIRKT